MSVVALRHEILFVFVGTDWEANMTVVAGLVDATSNSAIVVADSRVTDRDAGDHFDVCQKVAQLDNQGVFGFAGPIP